MLESVWDIFSNEVFVRRVHYRGYVGKVVTQYSEQGNVSVIEKKIDF